MLAISVGQRRQATRTSRPSSRHVERQCSPSAEGPRSGGLAAYPGSMARSGSVGHLSINWELEQVLNILFAANTIIEIIQEKGQRDRQGQRDQDQQGQQGNFAGG